MSTDVEDRREGLEGRKRELKDQNRDLKNENRELKDDNRKLNMLLPVYNGSKESLPIYGAS